MHGLDWYFAPAFLIGAITTVVFLGTLFHFLLDHTTYGDDDDQRNARRCIKVLLGYVVALTWPVSVPLAMVIGAVYLIRTAFPSKDKEN